MISKIISYLQTKLNIDTFGEVPKTHGAKYIIVEQTGLTFENGIYEMTVIVQGYAESLYEAAVLCTNVINAMKQMRDTEDIYAVDLNSAYNYTDTETKEYRYQAVFHIRY